MKNNRPGLHGREKRASPRWCFPAMRLGVVALMISYLITYLFFVNDLCDVPWGASTKNRVEDTWSKSKLTKPAPIQLNITGVGYTTCGEVDDNVRSGKWEDPNEGKVYARTTVTEPFCRISSHNPEYDPVRSGLFERGKYYEEDVRQRFVEILKNRTEAWVLDVGANIGYYSMVSAALGHRVLAFEPNPPNVMRLCESMRLNGWNQDRVTVYRGGVSDSAKEQMYLIWKHRHPGSARLYNNLRLLRKSKEDVYAYVETPVFQLDSFAEERGWFDAAPSDRPTFPIMKIDVEGHEPFVLKGALRLLRSGMVKNVLMEFRFLQNQPQISRQSLQYLLESGFYLFDDKIQSTAEEPGELMDLSERLRDLMGKRSGITRDLWWRWIEK